MKTLVLGIGNSLLSDEGIGIHVVRHLADAHAGENDVEFVDGGTLSFTLAGAIEEADRLVVIDAARVGGPAGTVAVFENETMDDFLGRNRKMSVHEVSLLDLLTIALLADRLPAQRALVGVEPENLDWGMELSPPVARAVPDVCARAWSLVREWRT